MLDQRRGGSFIKAAVEIKLSEWREKRGRWI
jgi:hypothetical protein